MVAAWYCVFSANSGILADPDLQKLWLYESPYVFYAGRWEGRKRGGEGRFCIYQCCRSVKLLKSYKKIEKPNIYFLMEYRNTFFHSIICLLANLRSRCPRAGSRQVRKVSFYSTLKKGFALIQNGGCWIAVDQVTNSTLSMILCELFHM